MIDIQIMAIGTTYFSLSEEAAIKTALNNHLKDARLPEANYRFCHFDTRNSGTAEAETILALQVDLVGANAENSAIWKKLIAPDPAEPPEPPRVSTTTRAKYINMKAWNEQAKEGFTPAHTEPLQDILKTALARTDLRNANIYLGQREYISPSYDNTALMEEREATPKAPQNFLDIW